MVWTPALGELREHLAELFDTDGKAKIVASDAGLDCRRITFAQMSMATWSSVLERAFQEGLIQELLEKATAPGRFPECREQLNRLYAEHLAQVERGQLLPPAGTRGPRAPRFRGTFVGREEELQHLRQALLDAPEGMPRAASIIGLHGLGGIGKTALALRFAEVFEPEFPGGVFWADLGTNRDEGEQAMDINPAAALRRALLRWAGELVLGDLEGASEEVLGGRLRTAFAEQLRWGPVLVVLDNVDSSKTLEPLLDIAAHCSVLVTTRQEQLVLESGLTPISLGGLSRAASLAYLRHTLPPHRYTAPGVEELLGHVMDHPLAVKLLAAELARDTRLEPRQMLEQLKRATVSDAGGALPAKMLERLHRCFHVSFENLPRRTLRPLLISLASQSPVSFSVEAASYVSGWGSVYRVRQGLHELMDLGLVEQAGEGRYKIHRLLRDYLRLAHGREGFGFVRPGWEVTSLAWLLPRLRLPVSAGQAVYDTRQESWFFRYAWEHRESPVALRKEWDGILLGIARRSMLGQEGTVRSYLIMLEDFLWDADFSGMSLGRVILDGAQLERARFEGADLSGERPRRWPSLRECREALGPALKSTLGWTVVAALSILFGLKVLVPQGALQADAQPSQPEPLLLSLVGGMVALGEHLARLLQRGGQRLDEYRYEGKVFFERRTAAVVLWGGVLILASLMGGKSWGVETGWDGLKLALGLYLTALGIYLPGAYEYFMTGWVKGRLNAWSVRRGLGGFGRRLAVVAIFSFTMYSLISPRYALENIKYWDYLVELFCLFFLVYVFSRAPERIVDPYFLPASYLRDANLREANLDRAGLRWCRLQRACLHRAFMRSAQLQHADLTDAKLLDADLTGASLEEANLTRADLRGARLEGASLTGATLDGALLEGATYDAQTRWPEGFVPLAAATPARQMTSTLTSP